MQSRLEQQKNVEKKFEQLFEQKGIYRRVAHDGKVYNPEYTELSALRECEFYEEEGKLVADISKTYSYAQYYANGGRYGNVLQFEMMILGQYLGIQFDPDTNYHQKLVISDPRSIEVLRNAGVVVEKPAATVSASASNPSLFAVASSPKPSFDMEALKTAEAEARQAKNALREKIRALENEFRTQENEHNLLDSLLNGKPISISRNADEKLNLPAAVGKIPLLDSFYTLRNLMKEKFYLTPSADWNPKSNTIDINLNFMYNQVSSEIRDASHFLHSISGSVQRRGDHFSGGYSHTLTHQQCDAAITALKLFQNKTPEEIREIRSRPVAKC